MYVAVGTEHLTLDTSGLCHSACEGAARTQTREEDMSEGESDMEGAAAAEEESPPRASGASHLEPTACDACHVIVEEFYTAWLELSRKQASQAEMQSGGAEIPAITYNDVSASTSRFPVMESPAPGVQR